METIHRAAYYGSAAILKGHYVAQDGKTLCGRTYTIGNGSLWTRKFKTMDLDDGDCKFCMKKMEAR